MIKQLLLAAAASMGLWAQLQFNSYSAVPTATDSAVGTFDWYELRANGTNRVRLQAPNSLASSYTITLPTAVPASNDYCLKGSTAGVTSWGACSSTLAWGNITGTLSSQTDLQTALDAKVAGAAALTTQYAVPYVTSSGALTQDQYFTYTPWPGSPGAAKISRLYLGDSSTPATNYYDVNGASDIHIRRTYSATPYTPSGGNFAAYGPMYVRADVNYSTNLTSVYFAGLHYEGEIAATNSGNLGYMDGVYASVVNKGSQTTLAALDGLYFYASNEGTANLNSTTIRGMFGGANANSTSNTYAVLGGSVEAYNANTGTVTTVDGFTVFSGATAGSGGTVTTASGINNLMMQGGSTMTTRYGYRARISTGSVTPTSAYGISEETGWRHRLQGNTAIGPSNSAPTETLDVQDDTPTTGATRAHVYLGAADTADTSVLINDGAFSTVHLKGKGTSPTITSGFGTSPTIAGKDIAGRVTVGTGGSATSGVVTFATAWATAPACTANNETTQQAVWATATTTTLTIAASTPFGAADTLTFVCIGY